MAEQETVPATELDIDSLTDEEMETLINTGQVGAAAPEGPAETPPTEDEDGKPAELVAAEEQPATEGDDEPGAEGSGEADPPQGQEDPEREELRLRAEEAELNARHFERLAGRNAGRIGLLEQRLQQMQSAPAPAPAADPLDDPVVPAPQPAPPVAAQPAATVDPSMMTLAMTQAEQEFALSEDAKAMQVVGEDGKAQHDPATGRVMYKPEFMAAVQRIVQQRGNPAHSGNPLLAKEATRGIFDDAALSVLRQQIAERRAANAKKVSDQAAFLKDRKRREAASSVGGGRAAAPRRQPKSLDDLSDDELGKLVDSRAGLDG